MFLESFMGFKGFSRIFQRCFIYNSSNFEGIFKDFHGILWVLQGSFKGISKKFLRVFQEGFSQFQGCFKED